MAHLPFRRVALPPDHYAAFAPAAGAAAHPVPGRVSVARVTRSLSSAPTRHTDAPLHAAWTPHCSGWLTPLCAASARRRRDGFGTELAPRRCGFSTLTEG